LNLLLLYESDRLEGDRFSIDGSRFEHLRDVLKLKEDDQVQVGLLNGPTGLGNIQTWGSNGCVIDVNFGSQPPRPKTDLILAMPRPKVLRRILPELVAMGIGQLVLIRSWRVEKSYLESDILLPENYEPLLHQGLMQAKCTWAPSVSFEPLFKPFIEDRCSALIGEGMGFIAHPGSEETLVNSGLAADQRAVLAIGPEGGWIEYELEAFDSLGFHRIGLGSRILKVETACAALMGQLELVRGLARLGVNSA